MKYVVCSVRDRCTQVFSQPFFNPTVESAIRSFRVLMNDPNAGLPKTNPEDFDLFHLGSFDDHSGLFDSHTPIQLALGREMLKPVPLAAG